MSQDFSESCYALLHQIPRGKVTTYKLIAEALNTKAWRAVGTALSKNPNLITTPCHRVVRSDGKMGGYALGIAKKISLLESEGIELSHGKVKDLEKHLYIF